MNEYLEREKVIVSTKERIDRGNDKLGQGLDKLALALKRLEAVSDHA